MNKPNINMHFREDEASDITETEGTNSRDENPGVSSLIEESQLCHCDLCGLKYEMMSDLNAHIKHHLEIPLLCEVCERFFDTTEEYEKHTQTHSNNSKSMASLNKGDTNAPCNDIRCHKCHVCSENFRRCAELHLHSLEHTPGKTLKCRFCGLSQTQQAYVTRHEKTCRKNTFRNENTHICPLCDHSFTRRNDLGRHIRKVHNYEKYRELLDKTSVRIANVTSVRIANVTNLPSDAFDAKRVTKSTCMLEKNCRKDTFANQNTHICSLCDHSFTRRSDLDKHIRILHNYKKYLELLDKTSVDMENISILSSDAVDVQRDVLECPDCAYQSTKRVGIIRHFYRNHYSKKVTLEERLLPRNSVSGLVADPLSRLMDKLSFHCDLCGQKFRLMPDLTAHIKNHLKIPMYCEICKCVFPTKEDYKRHMLTHSENKFSCRCGDVFETLAQLESHRTTAHGGGRQHRSKARLCLCHTCGKLIRKAALKEHMSRAHTTNNTNNQYICHICGTKYLTKSYYMNHLREHNGLKRLTCNVCNKVFMTEENLKSHKLIHPAVPRPYKCRYCDATYTKDNHRKKHENTRHIRNYSKKCPDCGKLFLDSRSLKVHSVVHTKQKRFECTVCGMKFTQKTSLNRHRKIHTKDKKHECTECNLKFVQKYALTRHMLVHTGDKPHKCHHCPQSFRQIFGLTKHIRKYHSNIDSQSNENK